MVHLPRYSLGTGDRFGREGEAQLAALRKARESGIEAGIVWNKSAREHKLIGSSPAEQRAAADRAVRETGWDGAYFVDADHIGIGTVEAFAPQCDFFTIDVADFIGRASPREKIEDFLRRHRDVVGSPILPEGFGAAELRAAAERYLAAVAEAGRVYRRIVELKGEGEFVVEVSMDETSEAQGAGELVAILAALADEAVPVSTIAPKFSGRFNKGIDYVGEVPLFLAEFEADVRAVSWASANFDLPGELKVSIHSGSDKFSLYPGIGEIVRRLDAGLHLKTAGTTWLEELIGLAEAGGEGLRVAAEIYRRSFDRYEELVAPYASVLDIDRVRLPRPEEVEGWDGPRFVAALRHRAAEPRFDRNFRQLLHVGFRVAAEMGDRFLSALELHRESVSRNVTENLWERHIRPLFLG